MGSNPGQAGNRTQWSHGAWSDAASLFLPPRWDPADPSPPSPPQNAPRTWSQTRGRWCEPRTRRRKSREASSPWVGEPGIWGLWGSSSGGRHALRALLWAQRRGRCWVDRGRRHSLRAGQGLRVGTTGLTQRESSSSGTEGDAAAGTGKDSGDSLCADGISGQGVTERVVGGGLGHPARWK